MSRSMQSAISLADIPSPEGITTGSSSLWPRPPTSDGGDANPGFLFGLAGGGGFERPPADRGFGRLPPGAGLLGVGGPLLE